MIKLILTIGVGACVGCLTELCVNVWMDVISNLKLEGIIKEKDSMEYQRGYERGRAEVSLYPMGACTFAIACSHCKNLNTDKCYKCKQEIRSGFEIKRGEEE